MPPEDDEALIERVVGGDERALDRLFRRYYPTMLRCAQIVCKNPADAQDVTQEAVETLMGSIGAFDRRSAFSTWLYRVVLNKAIDFRRKAARRERLSRELGLVSSGAFKPPQDDAVTARQIVEIILDFPEKERDAALLVDGLGLTHKEAAEIICCPTGTIGWLLDKARKRLSQIMDAKSDDRKNAAGRVREAGASAPVARC